MAEKESFRMTLPASEIDEVLLAAENAASSGLRKITLTTPLPANESKSLSDEENAMLNAAAAENRPLCIHFTVALEEEVMQVSVFTNKLCFPPATVYSSRIEFLGNTAVFEAGTLDGTTWSAVFQD